MEHITLPIPSKEKWTRGLMWVGVGLIATAIAVPAILTAGPHLIAAVTTITSLVKALAVFGAISLATGILAYIAVQVVPLIKKGIEIGAYELWSQFIDRYPVIHIALWRQKVLDGIEETRQAKKSLVGIVGENQKALEEIDERVTELKITIQDRHTSPTTRTSCEEELGTKIELRKPYESVVRMFTPAIEMFDQFITVQERYAQKLAREIELADAHMRAVDSINMGQEIYERHMGSNNAYKKNYEAARLRVRQELGNGLGRLEDMRRQMAIVVEAGRAQDEVKLATARRYMQEQLQTIDVPVEVVASPAHATTGRLLNLN